MDKTNKQITTINDPGQELWQIALCLMRFSFHFILGKVTVSQFCVVDILRLKAVGVGVVVIKGEKTGRYLAMNKNGRLYGSVRFYIW